MIELLKELLTGKVNRFILVLFLYLLSEQIFLRSRISELEKELSDCDSSYKKILFADPSPASRVFPTPKPRFAGA